MIETVYQVTGHSISEGDFTPSRRTDWVFITAFPSWEANRKMIEKFLGWYTDADVLANKDQAFDLVNDFNCARAIVASHLRERGIRLLDDYATPVSAKAMPNEQPITATDTYRLWVTKEEVRDIYTESNAAWELYLYCKTYGKIAVPDAKSQVNPKSGSYFLNWKTVLLKFSKHGGRYTDKYLRVE